MKFHDWRKVNRKTDLISILKTIGVEVSRTGDVPAVSVLSLMDRAAFVLSLFDELNEKRALIRSGSLTADENAMMQGEIDAIEDVMLMTSQETISGFTLERTRGNVLPFPARPSR